MNTNQVVPANKAVGQAVVVGDNHTDLVESSWVAVEQVEEDYLG
jgi:hypothetical protein